MKKWILGILVILIIIGIFVFTGESEPRYTEATRFDEDATITEPFTVLSGEQLTVANDTTVTFESDLTVDGNIACENGDMTLVVNGNATINERLSCDRGDTLPEGDVGLGISLVVMGDLIMGPDAVIETNGHVQFVENADDLAITAEDIERLYTETGEDSGEGQRIGPLVSDTAPAVALAPSSAKDFELASLFSFLQTKEVHAQPLRNHLIRGRMVVNTPPRGVRRLVIFNFPTASGITIQDFELSGPDGQAGLSDTSNSCDAKGKDGEDALRFNAFAPNLTVNNFTLNLGDGGDGGDAETTQDCDPGVAKGGNGGDSGNFKMRAGNNFEIQGAFIVHPGNGGAGGSAAAHGKDGDPMEDGGDATATGGDGADNKKKLSVSGTVAGTGNVQIGDIVGGGGGWATANPGTGGDGQACGENGGDGGKGTANGGDGGDASLTLGGGAGRAPFATEIGGSGGGTDTAGGNGGNGGHCDPTGPGGDGGDGGNASVKEGKGGSGAQGNAQDGVVLDETGGNGGNGGDGCAEGKGGSGGSGDPEGEDGKDGKNLCPQEPKEETHVSLPPTEDTLEVIQWMDYYIETKHIFLVDAHEPFCAEDHWHAEGQVPTVQGGITGDPDADGCGFCTISECPVMSIADPNN